MTKEYIDSVGELSFPLYQSGIRPFLGSVMRAPLCVILTTGAFLSGFSMLIAADDAKLEAIRKERKKYEGTWRVVSLEVNGNKTADDYAKRMTVTNHADGSWIWRIDGEIVAQGDSEIDPTKEPKTIDFTITDRGNRRKAGVGIYELNEDTRKLCWADPRQDRPKEFSARAESGHVLVVFRREKK